MTSESPEYLPRVIARNHFERTYDLRVANSLTRVVTRVFETEEVARAELQEFYNNHRSLRSDFVSVYMIDRDTVSNAVLRMTRLE